MPRTVVHKPLNSRNARAKLKAGRQPHLQSIAPNSSLAYRRAEGSREGVWLLRRYLGGGNNYKLVSLGRADDVKRWLTAPPSSTTPKPSRRRSRWLGSRTALMDRMTVRQAMTLYIEFKKSQGQSVADVEGRGTVHILPTLGDKIVSELTAQQLRTWLAKMAASPAQLRAKDGKPQYRPEPDSEEDVRKRRSPYRPALSLPACRDRERRRPWGLSRIQ